MGGKKINFKNNCYIGILKRVKNASERKENNMSVLNVIMGRTFILCWSLIIQTDDANVVKYLNKEASIF